MANEFLDFYRTTFMGQGDQVRAERAAEKAATKAASKAAQAAAEAEKTKTEAEATIDLGKAKEQVNSFLSNLRDAVEGVVKKASENMKEKTPEIPENVEKIEPIDDEYMVEYTYQPGDTFGQVIKNLGLGTDAGLWGTDGDVAFYTQQLVEQGALDNRGNIPIGTKIKLRRRGAPAVQMSPEQTEITAGKVVQDATYPALQKVTQATPRRI